MFFLFVSTGCILLAGAGALIVGANPKICSVWSSLLSLLAAIAGVIPCIQVLLSGETLLYGTAWEIPHATFSLCLDPLAAFFLVPILGLGLLTAVFGTEYLAHEHANLRAAWFCFHLLWASMILVVLAADGLLFMVAWEITVLSSFFLVIMGEHNPEKLRAGWVYLVASHLGAAFLLIMFLLLARDTGSLAFASFSQAAQLPLAGKNLLFLLAIIGFGTKAGFIPLHIWLPEAHPAAPSHVSALMSGVMIKTGIYGLIRTLFFLGNPEWWWGWTLLLIGLSSGILGVLFALAQHDLKRLLAYHSVENIGIIAIGLGFGLIGLSSQNAIVATLGLAGGLLHVLNHAVFKGLLFLGAGSVLVQTGTRDIDSLGGLLKKMPATGFTFLVGCISISGLPPFNGFVSEFLIYMSAFHAVLYGATSLNTPGLLIILGLSLIGGLAAACFVKAFSVVFLGNPRTKAAAGARESGMAMLLPMSILAALCLIIAVASPWLMEIPARVLQGHPQLAAGTDFTGIFKPAIQSMKLVTAGSVALIALLGLVIFIRRSLLSNREIGSTVTWGCGYAKPTAAMQYTGSSFAQPLTTLFSSILCTTSHVSGVDGYFPKAGSFSSHTNDLFEKKLFSPFFRLIESNLHRVVWIQNGVVQLSVLFIAITLLLLLILGLA
ncbi:MAG TPA: proton-conducting transporter membrane subunit [Candidatus Rifleibacterium sp.]|nr:proton-conducting transporter membrane subunit [Candidatus Rifleibacterium sp.]HPT45590.1 proton-conducting transporter membrane subunit [Candidatus Rifleibacterium sp.]